jgi:hypothetical protein
MTERSVRLAIAVATWLLTCATSLLVHAQPNVAQANAAEQTVARSAYAQGVEAFGRDDYATALERFEAADRAVSSANVKLMRARCLARLGRDADANAMYDAVLHEASRWDDGRYQASAEAAMQEQREIAERLSSPAPASSDGAPAADVATADASSSEAAPQAAPPATAELPPSPAGVAASSDRASTSGTALPVLPIALGAAGALGMVSFAVFGAMSDSQWSKLDAACPGGKHCDPSLATYASRGQTYQTVANVSLGVGAALLATGATLFVLHLREDAPEIAVTPTGARLRGTF